MQNLNSAKNILHNALWLDSFELPPLHILPFLKLVHVQEAVAVLPGQLELRRQREHGLVEVPEHSFHRGRVLVTMVDVVVQADKLPVGSRRSKHSRIQNPYDERQNLFFSPILHSYLGFFLMSSSCPTTWDTLVRTILKAISSSPMISNLFPQEDVSASATDEQRGRLDLLKRKCCQGLTCTCFDLWRLCGCALWWVCSWGWGPWWPEAAD